MQRQRKGISIGLSYVTPLATAEINKRLASKPKVNAVATRSKATQPAYSSNDE